MFADGYADQFGGAKGKKFMYKSLKNLLLEIHQKPMEEQEKILDDRMTAWKGTHDQIDDIIVFGICI